MIAVEPSALQGIKKKKPNTVLCDADAIDVYSKNEESEPVFTGQLFARPLSSEFLFDCAGRFLG